MLWVSLASERTARASAEEQTGVLWAVLEESERARLGLEGGVDRLALKTALVMARRSAQVRFTQPAFAPLPSTQTPETQTLALLASLPLSPLPPLAQTSSPPLTRVASLSALCARARSATVAPPLPQRETSAPRRRLPATANRGGVPISGTGRIRPQRLVLPR